MSEKSKCPFCSEPCGESWCPYTREEIFKQFYKQNKYSKFGDFLNYLEDKYACSCNGMSNTGLGREVERESKLS